MTNTLLRPGQRRRVSSALRLGAVTVGGAAPVSVQSMTKTDTRDVGATIAQLRSLAVAGCDIARLAVPDAAAAAALGAIRRAVDLPLVADIHFDYRLALAALDAGVDGLRLNPGNIGGPDRVRAVARLARRRGVPIRIGVNAGSLEPDLRARHGGVTPEALVESALRHAARLEAEDFHAIKISVKAADAACMVTAYRLLAQQTAYPLHLGLTEAGTLLPGTVRSAAVLGILLWEGIGDTIRVSLADRPEREVEVGLELLRTMGLRAEGVRVIACPTCGRCQVDVPRIAAAAEAALHDWARETPRAPRPRVAVMGCGVNGPGEARDADVALVGGRDTFQLYLAGRRVKTVPPDQALQALLEGVRKWARSADRPTSTACESVRPASACEPASKADGSADRFQ